MKTPTITGKRFLPIGMQTLAKLRGEDCYYVDKTGMAVDLIDSGSTYFLSRPRRFGKSLLVDTFKEFFTPDLSALQSDDSLLSVFDVEHIGAEALLFQTGYLTILSATPGTPQDESVYTLGYPNREVKASLNRVLLLGYGVPDRPAYNARQRLDAMLKTGDLSAMEASLRALFASIPHDWYRNNPLAGFEGHYASVFYSHFAALGLDIRVEDATNHGRIDMVVLAHGRVFVFEFKVVEQAAKGEALRQIKALGYAEKYRDRGEPVLLVGVEFSRGERNIVGFEVESA